MFQWILFYEKRWYEQMIKYYAIQLSWIVWFICIYFVGNYHWFAKNTNDRNKSSRLRKYLKKMLEKK